MAIKRGHNLLAKRATRLRTVRAKRCDIEPAGTEGGWVGASLDDPAGLFNPSLDGNTRRAIDFHEDDTIDEKALTALIRSTAELNTA